MTRVFRITYTEHLQNDKSEGDKVDSWRTLTQDVAVEDGDLVDAIVKLRSTDPKDVDPKLVVERRFLGGSLVSEAL